MKKSILVVGMVLSIVSSASAYWTNNVYDSPTIEANLVQGGSIATGPTTPVGFWSDTVDFGAGSHPVSIFSANNMEFTTVGWDSKNWGTASNSLVIKLDLSQWVHYVHWAPQGGYLNLSPGNTFDFKFSVDGTTWTKLGGMEDVPAVQDGLQAGGFGGTTSAPVYDFPTPDTKVLYLGYFGDNAGSGYASLKYTSNSGNLAFYTSSTPEPATLVMLGMGGLALLRRKQ